MKEKQFSLIIRLAMRLVIIQLFILSLVFTSYAKNAIGQEVLNKKISLSVENTKLKNVLHQIQSLADVNFIFSSRIIDVERRITFTANQKILGEILNEVFAPLNIHYEVIDAEIVLYTREDENKDDAAINIYGKVTDASGNPLVGATVQIKGTNTTTITNQKGDFVLNNVDPSAVLVVSYVGYTNAETPVNNKTEVNITLQPQENGLEQVVVIGYGARKKKDVTGAVSTVTSTDIEKSTSMSPELALQGKAAGVFIESGGGEPQARPTIRIRGVNTFGFAEPLYVIDGVPIYEGGSGVTGGAIGDIRSPINILSLINPNDIESISVLKDASAAAIYGVRASNGVILITTKKGRTGKPKVEVVTTYGVQNIPKTKDVLNTQQYFDLVTEAYNNNPDMDNGVIIPIGKKFGGLYSPDSSQYAGNGPTYDWQNELLNKDAPIQDYSVRVSGGNESTTYYFSGGYSKTESPLKSNFLERYSVAMNVDSKISKYVQAGLNMRLIQENSLVNTQADLGTMMSTIPFQPFYDKNDPTGFAPVVAGTFVPNPDYDPNLLNAGAPFIFADGEPHFLWGPQTRFNVFAFQALNNNKYQLLLALGNAFVQIEPITGLKIKGTLGGAFYFNLRKSWSNRDQWRFNQTPAK